MTIPGCSHMWGVSCDDCGVDINKSTPRHGARTPKPRGLATPVRTVRLMLSIPSHLPRSALDLIESGR